MAETLGSLADKLSIVELRRWHTEEAMCNPDAAVDIRHECALRLRIIDEQRADLVAEISQLWSDIVAGKRVPKVYKQLKMYNDARLRGASAGTPTIAAVSACPPAPPSNVLAFHKADP